MTLDEAKKLANSLVRESRGSFLGRPRKLFALVEYDPSAREDRIVFLGGKSAHSLSIRASNRQRVLAHWSGYVENNGLKAVPEIGQRVSFPSASAWQAGGYREGVVEAVTPTRARIAFRYKHGGRSETWQPIAKLRF